MPLVILRHLGVVLLLALCSCGEPTPSIDRGWRLEASLPSPTANNAVTSISEGESCLVVSALGIDSSLSPGGVTTNSYGWRDGDASWTVLPRVPGPLGRVAASAVALRGAAYVLGGYTISATFAEESVSSVDVYRPDTNSWSEAAELPTPIDDAVALSWRDRYIVVVSGWSTTDSVDLVQIYDVESDQWFQATAFPGTPVFGHAGAIRGDEIVIIDGVASGRFSFDAVNQAWRGILDPADPSTIVWQDLGQHPGPVRYRAAAGTTASGDLWFHGGTSEPYNFDGLAYDGGQASSPLASTLVYDADGVFSELGRDKPVATMDHRNLVRCGPSLLTVGGMETGPTVSAAVWRIDP